jgi:hypothetical protein
MSPELGVTSRQSGRLLAGAAAVLILGLAVWTAFTETVPELRLYDGWWMIGGAAVTVALSLPLIWKWRRERALAVIAGGAAIGAWVPLVILAIRAGIPIGVRLKGAIFFSNADVMGVALPVGAALAWLALREHRA